jgi:hypothetical protein
MPLYAGVCETNITPPLGVWMCGYGLRPSGCLSVHDELYARALVLNNGKKTVAILGMDLIGLDFDLVEQARAGIAQETGIPPEAILLNATHTHAGPNVRTFNSMGSRDPAYIDVLVRKLIGVTKQAANELRPAALGYGRAPVQIGINRRQTKTADGRTILGHNYAGPVDPNVYALTVLDSQGQPFALLFAHACHPTTLGGDNLAISAEFCGVACDHVREATGGEVVPLFLQGCAGNINPLKRTTYQAVRENGETLGEAAIRAMDDSQPLEDETLDFAEVTISLPLFPPPPLAECEKNVAEWAAKAEAERESGNMGRILHAEGLRDYAEMERQIAAQENPVLEKPFSIQRLSVGGVQILGLPGEIHVQYGQDFLRQSEKPVLTLSYTNGVHGYVPVAADYPNGGYEVDYAHKFYATLMYTPECEKRIREAVYPLLGVSNPDWTPYDV